MKNLLIGPIAALSLTTAAYAEGDLFIFNWTDYTPPDLIEKFEKETGINVTIDTYDSNETVLAKLKSGSTGYDIVVIANPWVNVMAEEGLIRKINASELPGYDNLDDRWKSPTWDPDNAYSVPYQWGLTSFVVNTDVYDGDIDTLDVLFNPPEELQGKIGMLNSPSEAVTLAQIYLGMDFCQTDVENMQKVETVLLDQAPHVKVYNSAGVIERMASNETAGHMAWNGNAMRARGLNDKVKMSFPKEGIVGWMDNLAVPTGARHPENAEKFISYLMQPENIAMVSNHARFANAVPGADQYLDAELRDAPELAAPDGVDIKFLVTCGEDANRLIDRVWTKVKK
ncbi:extracellular solute-binding protein [Ruegeria halocynthiae]|uniref:extracellular solute-binding protein n=1 Tax=Ruegeria halocynthiae TaxID=985054 RepID=UPI000569F45E|nr:extracellular solute-binding protein [Ruegeria halocynthiae]